jgi:hypothetical protein
LARAHGPRHAVARGVVDRKSRDLLTAYLGRAMHVNSSAPCVLFPIPRGSRAPGGCPYTRACIIAYIMYFRSAATHQLPFCTTFTRRLRFHPSRLCDGGMLQCLPACLRGLDIGNLLCIILHVHRDRLHLQADPPACAPGWTPRILILGGFGAAPPAQQHGWCGKTEALS